MEDQGRRTFGKLVKPVGIIVVAALAAGAAVLGANYFGAPPKTDVDRVAEIGRNLPLVGLVLSEYPALDARYRAAIEEDLKNPVKGGLTASNRFGAEIRQQYVVPALRNADDASALSAVAGLHKLMLHLQAVNPTRCRDFGLEGLPHPSQLDAEGLALFKRALALQEDAYRTGKTAPSRTALPDQEAVKLLAEAGFTRADVEQLARLDKLAVAEGCAVIVKFYSTSARIPTERGGPLARWLLISVL
jgi:hypothetical protein